MRRVFDLLDPGRCASGRQQRRYSAQARPSEVVNRQAAQFKETKVVNELRPEARQICSPCFIPSGAMRT